MSLPYQIVGEVKNVTTGVATASTALPLVGGAPARFVRIQATNLCYVAIGPSGVTATNQSMIVGPYEEVILACVGNTHIAYLDLAASVVVSLAAVELAVPR